MESVYVSRGFYPITSSIWLIGFIRISSIRLRTSPSLSNSDDHNFWYIGLQGSMTRFTCSDQAVSLYDLKSFYYAGINTYYMLLLMCLFHAE